MDVLSSTSHLHCFFRKSDNPFPPFPIHSNLRNLHLHHRNLSIKVAFKAGPLEDTHQVFDEIPVWDTFAWNNLIKSHVTNGDSHLVAYSYQQMLLRGVRIDKHTLPRILTASNSLSFAKQVHAQALIHGLSSDPYVFTSLIDMYGRLDSADSAMSIYENFATFPPSKRVHSISSTLLAKLYVQEGKPSSALALFYRLFEFGGVEVLDSVALSTAINACAMLKSLHEGRKVHKIVKLCGLEFNDVLVSNSLLKMYLDCNSLIDAREIFDRMVQRDALSWTEMIRGYVKNGGFNEGFKLFRQMMILDDGVKPDSLSFSTILPACARIACHKLGKEIHGFLIRNGIDFNLILQNALMDMYVKSGFIESAIKIFDEMKDKDVISWTIMIMGYSLHGRGEVGVTLFREMQRNHPSTLKIDEKIYAAVLHACCSARLVEEGKFYFNCIGSSRATVKHRALLVALLSRDGRFDEAREFMEDHKIERDTKALRALLDGCRNNQNLKMGKRIIEQLCELEPLNANNYVTLSNWYAENCKHDMVNTMKETIRDMGLRPNKGYSWIELNNKVHVFGTGDVKHPRSERVYWELQSLMKKIDEQGSKLESDFSFHDVDEERECVPTGHSEMLAVSFGLISTQQGATIRVTKNLSVCRTCHDAIKVVSKLVNREIILKDPNRFHHFKDGICSCGDFW